MTLMDIPMKQTDSQTQRTELWLPSGTGVGSGWSSWLELADVTCYIENG